MTDPEKHLELKTKRREKKKKPAMAVHGKRVFQIVRLHAKRRKKKNGVETSVSFVHPRPEAEASTP